MRHIRILLLGTITFVTPALSSAKTPEKLQPQVNSSSLISLKQSDADKQRAAERTLREAESSRQDQLRLNQNQNNSPGLTPFATPTPYGAPGSQFGNQGYPYQPPGASIQNPATPPDSRTEAAPDRQPKQSELNSKRRDQGTASVSLGFKNGIINPSIGYRFGGSPIGIELGAVLNQDSLPGGRLNDFSVPNNLLQQFPNGFNSLGRKSLSPQIGADVLGYFNVAPNISLYGGIGLYVQSQSIITRSNITNELYKDASSTDVNVAASGGVDVRISESLQLGGGYHSLRGITAKVGYNF